MVRGVPADPSILLDEEVFADVLRTNIASDIFSQEIFSSSQQPEIDSQTHIPAQQPTEPNIPEQILPEQVLPE